MTINEAAAKWAVSPVTVRRWIKSGKIKAELRDTPNGKVYDVVEDQPPAATPTDQGGRHDGADVLRERIRGLEAMLDMHKSEIEHKNAEIKALIATTARMSEINAELQSKALPDPKERETTRQTTWWSRLLGKG